MTRSSLAFAMTLCLLTAFARAEDVKPIKALMLVGGCCHDYKTMPGYLTDKVGKLANVKFDIKFLASAEEDAALLRDAKFAEGYDVIVYDICFGEKWKDGDYDGAIEVAHMGKPAVFIHCAMHTFRPPRDAKDPALKEREAIADAKWHALAGMDTRVHDKYAAFSTTKVDTNNPILIGFPDDWKTTGDEMYNTIKMMPTATPLLQAKSPASGKTHTVAWVNHFGKAKVFGTTLGHDMKTGADADYQKLLANGILWACDKLGDDGKPLPGYAGH